MGWRAWLLPLGLIFFLGILLGSAPLSAFALMLGLVGALAAWWGRHALDRVEYRRKPFYRRGFPGETLLMRVEVENRKLLPLSWLRVEDAWPSAVGPQDNGLFSPSSRPEEGTLVNFFSLRPFEKARRSYDLLLRRRGVYRLGPAHLESGDFFGIHSSSKSVAKEETLTVFPQPAPLGRLDTLTDDPFGERRSRKRLFEDPTLPMGVRDYHPEDDFRFVHWPATARTGELQVRVYQPASAQVVVVCLNVSTLSHIWEGTDPELLEALVGVTTTLVQQLMEDGYQVGLSSNGSLAHADQPFRTPTGRSPGHLAYLLTTLASVTPFITGPFDRFLLAEAPRLPYGAALLVVTAFVTDELMEALVRLKQHGRKITLVSLAKEAPPAVPGVTALHLPPAWTGNRRCQDL